MHWNWLKIGLWDPQTPYSNPVYLVSLDLVSPYPKIGQSYQWPLYVLKFEKLGDFATPPPPLSLLSMEVICVYPQGRQFSTLLG